MANSDLTQRPGPAPSLVSTTEKRTLGQSLLHIVSNHGLFLLAILFVVGYAILLPDTFLSKQTFRAIMAATVIVAFLSLAEMIVIATNNYGEARHEEARSQATGGAGRARHSRGRLCQSRHRSADAGGELPVGRPRDRAAYREWLARHGARTRRRACRHRSHQRRQAAGDGATGRLILSSRRFLRHDARRAPRYLRSRRFPGVRRR